MNPATATTVAGLLDKTQVADFHAQGYLLLPADFLPTALLTTLTAVLPSVMDQDGPQRILERDGTTVRSVYGLHRSSAEIAELVRAPELLNAARQLLGDEVYVHQSKVNFKAPFSGDQWEWHQDYIYWLHNDGIRRPDLLNVAIFVDEVTEFNGPLTFVPGSHSRGLLAGMYADGMPRGYEEAPAWVATLTADEHFRVAPDVIADLATSSGMVSPKGPAGSVLFFDPNILHSSGSNISPFRRAMLLLVYNAAGNRPYPVRQPRPAFLAEPDTTPLSPVRPYPSASGESMQNA
jgi:ectoine hydroxylase